MMFSNRDGLNILLPKLARCISRLAKFAQDYKDLPTLGITQISTKYTVLTSCSENSATDPNKLFMKTSQTKN
jgi:hypothetical protein